MTVAATFLADRSTERWCGPLIFDRVDCCEEVGR